MEKESTIKPSVAELAGKFTCQTSFPTGAEQPQQIKSVRKRPPRTLQLPVSNDACQGPEEQKGEVTSHPPRRNRNSALIEKLQANLARSPTALLPSPKSPGAMKSYLTPFSLNSPCSPCSQPAISTPSQEEVPASFETPAEGKILQNINKGRARHSIKRRPPSRRQRKTSEDEVGAEEDKTVLPGPESTASGTNEDEAGAKQKIKAEETDGDGVNPSTSQLHSEANQSTAADSKQQSPADGESEPCKEIASAEEEGKADGETKSMEQELASIESMETEPQREGERAAEVKEGQEQQKEEEGGDQEEQTKGSEQ